jgi:predicted enzyme related to lactoylglutathione lyase
VALELLRQPLVFVHGHLPSSRSVKAVTNKNAPTYHGTCQEMFMMPEMNTVIVPVRDLDQAKRLYGRLLGVAPYVDQPYYVGFRAGDREVGLDPHGHSKGMTGPIGYRHVDDIEETVKLLLDAGAEVQQAIRDVGGGTLIAWVKDADGNTIGLRRSR